MRQYSHSIVACTGFRIIFHIILRTFFRTLFITQKRLLPNSWFGEKPFYRFGLTCQYFLQISNVNRFWLRVYGTSRSSMPGSTAR